MDYTLVHYLSFFSYTFELGYAVYRIDCEKIDQGWRQDGTVLKLEKGVSLVAEDGRTLVLSDSFN